jgi:hypothetical protein
MMEPGRIVCFPPTIPNETAARRYHHLRNYGGNQSSFDISLACRFAQRWSRTVSSASRHRYRMRRLLDDVSICATMAETSLSVCARGLLSRHEGPTERPLRFFSLRYAQKNVVSKFDQVRSTSIIPRNLQRFVSVSPFFEPCTSSIKFDAVRSTSYSIIPPFNDLDVSVTKVHFLIELVAPGERLDTF